MWFNFFDRIYLINLPARKDRYWVSVCELTKYNIPYEVVKAHSLADGRDGLYITMREIFEKAVAQGLRNILIFEDDLKFLIDPHPIMLKALSQLPEDYDMLYLGCNLVHRPTGFYSENLLPVSRALSTHAVAYSRACMQRILALPKVLPIDLFFANVIQPAGRSYCTYPLIVSQYPGYSDIMKMPTDWRIFIDQRFAENTKHLQPITMPKKGPGTHIVLQEDEFVIRLDRDAQEILLHPQDCKLSLVNPHGPLKGNRLALTTIALLLKQINHSPVKKAV